MLRTNWLTPSSLSKFVQPLGISFDLRKFIFHEGTVTRISTLQHASQRGRLSPQQAIRPGSINIASAQHIQLRRKARATAQERREPSRLFKPLAQQRSRPTSRKCSHQNCSIHPLSKKKTLHDQRRRASKNKRNGEV